MFRPRPRQPEPNPLDILDAQAIVTASGPEARRTGYEERRSGLLGSTAVVHVLEISAGGQSWRYDTHLSYVGSFGDYYTQSQARIVVVDGQPVQVAESFGPGDVSILRWLVGAED